MQKESPILFQGEMVSAILSGKKTQTRRLVKLPLDIENPMVEISAITPPDHFRIRGTCDGRYGEWLYRQPYRVGDILWVRECFGWNPDFSDGISPCYRADKGHEHDGIKWKPSIHMPRSVCRLRLEVTGCRIERLQEISERDAAAEGVESVDDQVVYKTYYKNYQDNKPNSFILSTAKKSFYSLWAKIHGRAEWYKNPWVWVVEFKKV
jgi:hypothetical protein